MALLWIVVCVISGVVANDIIYFPDQIPAQDDSCRYCKNQNSIEMALRLVAITDENQLFRDFIGNPGDEVSDRFGDVAPGSARSNPITPKLASCIPELRTVSLPMPKDGSTLYWPKCTRVERCGGCCGHDRLSCQPIKTEQVDIQVVLMEFNGAIQYKGRGIVSVERHTKCQCECDIKEENCTSLQEYRRGECRCVCKDKDAKARCSAGNNTKRWNPGECSCECIRVHNCSTGHFFSSSSCRCERDESRRIPNYSLGRGR